MPIVTKTRVPVAGCLALIAACGALAVESSTMAPAELPGSKRPALEGETHGSNAEELPAGWTQQVIDLYPGSVVPRFAPAGDVRARFAINERTGAFRVRITTRGIPDATGAQIRASTPGRSDQTLVELEQSFQSMLVWGSEDINNECVDIRLSPADLALFLAGRVYLSLETLSDFDGPRRGGLLPSASAFSFVGSDRVSVGHQPEFPDKQIGAGRADKRISK